MHIYYMTSPYEQYQGACTYACGVSSALSTNPEKVQICTYLSSLGNAPCIGNRLPFYDAGITLRCVYSPSYLSLRPLWLARWSTLALLVHIAAGYSAVKGPSKLKRKHFKLSLDLPTPRVQPGQATGLPRVGLALELLIRWMHRERYPPT